MTVIKQILQRGNAAVDATIPNLLRIAFGLLGCVGALRFFWRGWIAEYYIAPHVYFPFVAWAKPWPGIGMYIHFAVMALAALGIALGYRYRLSACLYFLTFTYVELLDKTRYLNHYYLISILSFLFILLPLNRGWSLDAKRDSKLAEFSLPQWCVWVLQIQIGLVYFFAGLAKLKPEWLLDAQPLKIWLRVHDDLPMIGQLLSHSWTAYAASWIGALFDLTIVFWLLWPKTRRYAYAAVLLFHLCTGYLFHIGLFPWIMSACALIFFTPPAKHWSHTPSRISLRGFILGIHLILQLLLPLRHFLYPGNVLWTEQGFRFAWHVMLMEKAGNVVFHIHNPQDNSSWEVLPKDYLQSQQVKMMSTQPDMIVQMAQWIAASYPFPVEVRADAQVSLNGQPSAALIDPKVDLNRVRLSFASAPWILLH